MAKVWSVEWHTEEQCAASANEFVHHLKGGMTVGLAGDLGAGKTTFVRYLAAALSITESVTSPTFVLQHEYRFPEGVLEHWDLYRLSAIPEELWEPVQDSQIRLIEWYDRFEELTAACHATIHITTRLLNDQLVRDAQFVVTSYGQ